MMGFTNMAQSEEGMSKEEPQNGGSAFAFSLNQSQKTETLKLQTQNSVVVDSRILEETGMAMGPIHSCDTSLLTADRGLSVGLTRHRSGWARSSKARSFSIRILSRARVLTPRSTEAQGLGNEPQRYRQNMRRWPPATLPAIATPQWRTKGAVFCWLFRKEAPERWKHGATGQRGTSLDSFGASLPEPENAVYKSPFCVFWAFAPCAAMEFGPMALASEGQFGDGPSPQNRFGLPFPRPSSCFQPQTPKGDFE